MIKDEELEVLGDKYQLNKENEKTNFSTFNEYVENYLLNKRAKVYL